MAKIQRKYIRDCLRIPTCSVVCLVLSRIVVTVTLTHSLTATKPRVPSSSLWRGEVHPNPIEMAPTPQAFWSELEGAKEYDEKLEKKKQQDPETHGDRTCGE